ncbi:tetratricopeptide repeat protein [bacterium LRH843]|nr:tetratricopeptide repeat protein [bacterium LRH843]
MNDWITSWHALYKNTKTKWAHLTLDQQEHQLDFLEETAGSLIDQWAEMDELLNQLRLEKEQLQSVISYESPGTTYYELEMFDQAAETLEYEQTNGEHEEMRYLYLGFSYLFSEQLQKAKEKFLYLIHVSRNMYVRHFSFVGLGCTNTRLERICDAIEAFECANRLTTTNDVMYNLGICYFSEEAFHLAKFYFSEYVKNVPDDGEALFYLGCCQWQENEKEAAWSSWLSSVHILDSTHALLALAYVLEWHGHHRAAIHCYKRLLEKNYDLVKVLHGLAWNYALEEDKTKALTLFREALSVDPMNENIRESLLWLQKRWPEGEWKRLSGS